MIFLYKIIWHLLSLYSNLLIIYIILSWLFMFGIVNPYNGFVSKINQFLYVIIEPVLGFVRRFLPSLPGIDLSPLIVFLAIWLLQTFMASYILPQLYTSYL